jgi:hypothetical protein
VTRSPYARFRISGHWSEIGLVTCDDCNQQLIYEGDPEGRVYPTVADMLAVLDQHNIDRHGGPT